MFSKFFIERPIFATVISLIITLAGIVSITVLPVEQYPNLTPPSVQVSATYTGASAEVIAETVASPLEEEINGVDNMIYMNSMSSSSGDMSIYVYFSIGTDPDMALVNVNNRVQSALVKVPEDVRRYGVTVEKVSSTFLQIITLTSPDKRYDAIYLGNYALVYIVDELKRIPGVGDASVLTSNDYAIRIWLKPDRLQKWNITTSEVATAITEQNAQRAVGKVGQPPLPVKVDSAYSMIAEGRFTNPEQFEEIILRANPDGSTLKLKDVASVELGAQTYEFVAKLNGTETIPIGIYLSPGANAIETVDAVDKKIKELSARFPEGIEYQIPYDSVIFVRESLKEVVKTLFEAMFLVFLVVFIFLKNWRATLIPCLAVPVSIVGTFAGMLVAGFTINTLTLFGLVLAIGIVVDDAIIVMENVERIMKEDKLDVKSAAIKAMEEVSGPVVAIVLVLCAVFVPVSFMGGLAGTMYQQFAITIAVSVVISGLVALTLTPALCVILLKEETHISKGWVVSFFDKFDRGFSKLTNGYAGVVELLIKKMPAAVVCFALVIFFALVMFKKTPTSLVPDEDQGQAYAVVTLDPGASLTRSEAVMEQMQEIIRQEPQVEEVINLSGYDMLSSMLKNNYGSFFITLKPWEERKKKEDTAQSVAMRIMGKGSVIKDGAVVSFNPPAIIGMSTTGGFEGYIQNKGTGDSKELQKKVNEVIAAAAKRPELSRITTTIDANIPQLKLSVDKIKAHSLGVSLDEIYTTMQASFGSYYVNDFIRYQRIFKVMMQADGNYRLYPEQVGDVYVRSSNGDMLPLSSFVTLEKVTGADAVERFNAFPAAKVLGNPAPGYSSGQALQAMEDVCKEVLGSDYELAWTGSAYQEKESSASSTQTLLLALLVVFLILAAQYESWSLPIVVVTAIPFALFGALTGINIRGLENDTYFQIALVTLIGLSAKNAILIVEFAVLLREQGEPLFKAAVDAARLRFRPIVMTSLAFILGCVPLVVSSGAGAASRHSIGTGVVGGMLAATILVPMFIPLFFVLISKLAGHGKDVDADIKTDKKA